MFISIITINFNNIAGLLRTLDSFSTIVSTDVEVEHIFIDALSTDGSGEVIRDFCADKNNCRVIIESDEGIFDAMNKGVSVASGTHILFINSGDMLIGASLSLAVDVDICVFSTVYRRGMYDQLKRVKTLNTFWGIPFCHQSAIVRKSLHSIEPFETTTLYSDFVFFSKYLNKSSLAILCEPLSVYDVGGVSDIDSFHKLRDFTRQHQRFFGGKSFLVFVFLLARLFKLKTIRAMRIFNFRKRSVV